MMVRDVMSPAVAMVDADATVAQAAQLMRDFDVGFLPVVLESVCAGVLTDRDIAVRVVAAGLDPHEARVATVMSRGVRNASPQQLGANEAVASIGHDATVEEAADMMDRLQVRRLAIHDEDFAIVGIVSLSDVAGSRSTRLTPEDEELASTLQSS